MGILHSIGILLDFMLGIYIWLILIRVLLSWVTPDPHNPIVQFLVRATEPIMASFRRLLPPVGGFDFSPIAALMTVMLAQRMVGALFHGGNLAGLFGEIFSVVHLLLTFYMIALLVRGGFHIHFWITFRKRRASGINLNHPIPRFIFQATEPVLSWMRRWVPTYLGLDISPFVAAFLLVLGLSFLQEIIASLAPGMLGMHQ